MAVHVFFSKLVPCEDSQKDVRNIYPFKAEEFRVALSKRRKSEILTSHLLLRNAFKTVYGKDFRLYLGEYGKPLVKDGKVYISISHSGDYVMVAVSDCNVGCDIQKEVKGKDPDKLAKRFLSEKECEKKSKSSEKLHLFYKYWTYRESYCKMNGDGLSRLNHRIAIDDDSVFLDNKKVKAVFVDGMYQDYTFAVCSEKDTEIDINWPEIVR